MRTIPLQSSPWRGLEEQLKRKLDSPWDVALTVGDPETRRAKYCTRPGGLAVTVINTVEHVAGIRMKAQVSALGYVGILHEREVLIVGGEPSHIVIFTGRVAKSRHAVGAQAGIRPT